MFDHYSLLHMAVGIVAYFWGMDLFTWTMLHTIFEFIENTTFGVWFIDKHIKAWPGGKGHPDAIINSLGDVIAGSVGWLLASFVSNNFKY